MQEQQGGGAGGRLLVALLDAVPLLGGAGDNIIYIYKRCLVRHYCVLQTLLHGLLGVLLYWLLRYRAQQLLVPFVWLGPGSGASSLLLENTHALLTLTGTIYCTGQGGLLTIDSE